MSLTEPARAVFELRLVGRPGSAGIHDLARFSSAGQHLLSVLQEGRESANIDAGLGFIWRISVAILIRQIIFIRRRASCRT
jgi:hypothetical protein